MTDLKTSRTMAGLTQYELARETDGRVPRWKISLIEALQVEPTFDEENALRTALAKHLKTVAATAGRLGDHLEAQR
jgi:predicted transcriptional regulator